MTAIWWGGGRIPLDLTKCLSAVTERESNISLGACFFTLPALEASQQLGYNYNKKSATLQYKPHTSIWTHCLSLAKKYYLSTKTSLKVQGSQKLIHNKLNHTVKLNLPEVTLRKFPPGIICKTIAVVLVSATSVFGNLICLFLGTPSTYFHSHHLICFSLPVYRLRARFILCVILVF